MQQSRSTLLLARLVAYIVLFYGLALLAGSLLHEIHSHPGRHFSVLLIEVPQVIGISFVYLGYLLLRRKYNAWWSALALFGASLALDVLRMVFLPERYEIDRPERIMLPLLIVALLLLTRSSFKVRSDIRSFRQAVRFSVFVLVVAFLYGTAGFMLLDKHDFHREIGLVQAMHQTIDQVGLTTDHPVAHTKRARLFLDSLPVISIAAVGYALIALFDPIRMRFSSQPHQRELAEDLLRRYPSDIDDFFKLWPHDKLYYFDQTNEAGLAYQVNRGVALVVGNQFGNPKRFRKLLQSFGELCFVNDWLPSFVHVDDKQRKLYETLGMQLQKIGEEAVLDLSTYTELQTGKSGKYFREIRNRFVKLGYSVEVVQPPHSQAILNRLREISNQWLEKPGRAERGFMLGYHSDEYLQQCSLALVRDEAQQIQGFINVVPTYEDGTANYDLLRCSNNAPGNCNDFLLMGLLDYLVEHNYRYFNLGLSPLAGLDDAAGSKDKTTIDTALRFVYSNGDRFYSFSGLRRYKDKYKPTWQPRYIAYPGGIRNFTRILTAQNRAMKVTAYKNKRPFSGRLF